MYKKLLAGVLSMLLAAAVQANEPMPEPYASIADLPFDSHGWFGHAGQFDQIFAEHSPVIAIEVGSWLGCSTRHIAAALPEGGKLYAVDTWAGSAAEAVHMQDPRLPYLYQLFLSNVKHAGLTHKIVPIRMRSLEAAKALNVKADFIYIDASHEEEDVYQDILAWYPHLKEGGVFCGDDWLWGSVRQAVIRAAATLKMQIYAEGNFWKFI